MSVEVGTGSTKSEPNVVPLCDILLVLLIIFMVITPVTQRGIDIQLPETQTGDSNIVGVDITKVVLTLEKDQTIYINQETISKDLLGNRLRSIYESKQDKVIFIRADASVPYKEVLSLIDIARGAGVEVLGVMTTPYESGSGDTSVPQ